MYIALQDKANSQNLGVGESFPYSRGVDIQKTSNHSQCLMHQVSGQMLSIGESLFILF